MAENSVLTWFSIISVRVKNTFLPCAIRLNNLRNNSKNFQMISTKEIKAASPFSKLVIGVLTPFILGTQWKSDSLLLILIIVGKRALLLLRRSAKKVRKKMISWEASKTMNSYRTSLLDWCRQLPVSFGPERMNSARKAQIFS